MEDLFSEEIARQKIHVANDVLTVVSAALDAAKDQVADHNPFKP